MSTSKSGVFYGTLIAFVSLVAGMVIASKLDLTPASMAAVAVSVPATNSTPITGPMDATTFRTIAHEQSPTVVSILIRGHQQRPSVELFQFPPDGRPPSGGGNGRGGGGGADQEVPIEGAGSGFIIDKAGYILTNNHVIEDADTIAVKFDGAPDFADGIPAKVVGHDELRDVALIQLTELPKMALPEAKFGDSSQMAAGDWVMAIGNPFELSNTVTVGVVSSASRSIPATVGRNQNFIQTDAAINRGNSGGPLLNLRGEVIGINTLIFTDQTGLGSAGGNLGIGFAIPINEVKAMLPMLKTGKVSRGRIGVSVSKVPIPKDLADAYGLPSQEGAYIARVDPKGPGAAGGLKIKDVVVEFNGQKVHDDNALVNMVVATLPGTTVPVKVYRDRKPLTLTVKVADLDLAAENASQTVSTLRLPRNIETKQTVTGVIVADVDASAASALKLPGTTRGALVVDLDPSGDAVLQTGPIFAISTDVILNIDGHAVTDAKDAVDAFAAVQPGHTATVTVWRDGEEQIVLLKRH